MKTITKIKQSDRNPTCEERKIKETRLNTKVNLDAIKRYWDIEI